MHEYFLTTNIYSITEAIIYFQYPVDKSVKRPLPTIIVSKICFAIEFCISVSNLIPCA